MPRRSPTLDIGAILARAGIVPTGPDDEVTAALLDATSSLLARYGMRRWTMDDVAEQAGLGRATVYRRFVGRDELVNATLARDIRRFFEAISAAVADVRGIEQKVVEGFLVGLRAVRRSTLPALLQDELTANHSLLLSAPVLALGRAALVDAYQTLVEKTLSKPERREAELVAETLVRLAVSFTLMPESTIDFDDEVSARKELGRVVRPLLTPP
jgi:AcrR family transcriptional regulator